MLNKDKVIQLTDKYFSADNIHRYVFAVDKYNKKDEYIDTEYVIVRETDIYSPASTTSRKALTGSEDARLVYSTDSEIELDE